jgi:hypothetical protein
MIRSSWFCGRKEYNCWIFIYILGAGPIPGRKRHHSTWLETDLDSLVTLDHGLDSPASPQHQISPPGSKIQPPAPPVDSIAQTPLYVNTDASSMRTGNYPSPRIIANTRGYVRYMRAAGREINKMSLKRNAPTSDSSEDTATLGKLRPLVDTVYMQYMKCPFTSICQNCAIYEKHLMHILNMSCMPPNILSAT